MSLFNKIVIWYFWNVIQTITIYIQRCCLSINGQAASQPVTARLLVQMERHDQLLTACRTTEFVGRLLQFWCGVNIKLMQHVQ